MAIKSISMALPEGNFSVDVQLYGDGERKELQSVYRLWRELTESLGRLHSRGVNLPDGLSEGVFCLATGAVRMIENISGANSSFDCYDTASKRRIQVKAASIIPDLTSFGPRSVWDELYFLDFFRKGSWDGTVDIYRIDSSHIYGHSVNRYQTFSEQQAQGRRPRFSIYSDVISRHQLNPWKTYHLWEAGKS